MSEDSISVRAKEALRHIRNWLMHHSEMPSMRELMDKMEYKSPRSTMLLMQELESSGFLKRKSDGTYTLIKDLNDQHSVQTTPVPLVGMVAAGTPIFAEQNIEAMIPVSTKLLKFGTTYFLLKVKGDSMDLAGIDDGDLVLVRQQQTADNGNIVVALIDDDATIKEFHRTGNLVRLIPHSSNSKHMPIIVGADFRIQGLVTEVLPKIIK